MDFDFTSLAAEERYRLLVSFVAPRPIALVTTVSEEGVPNAAPMSFFNVFSHEPPIVILGLGAKPDGKPEDTTASLLARGEFVVNMVDAALAEAMVTCGINYPAEIDEVATAGLSLLPARQIDGGFLAETPCAMECRVAQTIDYARRSIVLGEVVEMHVQDACLTADGCHVRPEVYQPIARLHGDNYVVADRQFELKRPAEAPEGVVGRGAA